MPQMSQGGARKSGRREPRASRRRFVAAPTLVPTRHPGPLAIVLPVWTGIVLIHFVAPHSPVSLALLLAMVPIQVLLGVRVTVIDGGLSLEWVCCRAHVPYGVIRRMEFTEGALGERLDIVLSSGQRLHIQGYGGRTRSVAEAVRGADAAASKAADVSGELLLPWWCRPLRETDSEIWNRE